MTTEKTIFLTIAEAAALIQKKELSPVEVVKACLAQIEHVEEKVMAWVTVLNEKALEEAKKAESEIIKGQYKGALHGIPYGAKDIIYTKGVRTTAGSKVNPNFVPAEDAMVIQKLKSAGAILLGKTTTTEYAFLWGEQKTRNPWNLAHTPGGSSSGSGAAVAASMAMFTLGTQTVGSLIRPAAYNGLTCMKGTYGRVSRYGVIPASWSLDHVGALTKTVEDSAIVNMIISGYDANDKKSLKIAVPDYRKSMQKSVEGMVVGIPEEFFITKDSAIEMAMLKAKSELERMGMTLKKIMLPDMMEEAFAASDIVMCTEAASYHAEKFAKFPDRFGDYIRSQLKVGGRIPAVDYLQAQKIRAVFKEKMSELFSEIDVLVVPATKTLPPKGQFTGDPAFNGPFTNSGLPVLTVPVGFDLETHLPIGMQIVAPHLEEERILAVGAAYQQRTTWHKMHPAMN